MQRFLHKLRRMRNIAILLTITLLTTFAACGDKTEKQPEEKPENTTGNIVKNEGDSTRYGLACDGCTDSVVVFLPEDGKDPVTYDIIEARKHGRIIGRPRIGDWICLIVNGNDSTKADLVINLDRLKGTWVNMEKPELRKHITAEKAPELSEEQKKEIDSLLRAEMTPIEIGFSLKRGYTAQAVGNQYNRTNDENSPVIYPTPKRYTEWHIFNGHLILTESRGNLSGQQPTETTMGHDTVDIIFMMRDTLRLRYSDGTEKGFYRK